jgi:hypothetical protein
MAPLPAVPSLLVPVSLAALCVGDDDYHQPGDAYGVGDFAAVATDFSALPYVDANGVAVNQMANLASNVVPPPFTPVESKLPIGIHLHWALPAALSKGSQGADRKLAFPSAPNRWLIVRTLATHPAHADPAIKLDAWVLESDRFWDPASDATAPPHNALACAFPTASAPDATPSRAWQTVGRVYPLGDWPGETSASRPEQLTALGYGRPEYAAAYPHCPNVYGFYDPAQDIDLTSFPAATTSVAYQVIGWYSDPGDDPVSVLYEQTSSEADDKRLGALATTYGWTVPTGSPVPPGLVCHGLLHSLTWDPSTKYLPTEQPAPIAARVAVGSTVAEAVSVLIAAERPDVPGIERLLNLFQLGLLSRQQDTDFAARAEDAEHAAGFGSLTAGVVWQVKRTTVGDSGKQSDAGALPAAGADPLVKLNEAQRTLDVRQAELQSRRASLFADWTRYMELQWPKTGVEPSTLLSASDAFNYVHCQVLADHAAAETAVTNAQNDASQAYANLVSALGGDQSDYVPVATHAPRYWRPNDPVVLVSGAELRASERYGQATGTLACRGAGDELSAMAVAQSPNAITVAATSLQSLGAGSGVLPAPVAALVGEGHLLDPGCAWRLAALAVAAGASESTAELTAAIQKAQRAIEAGQSPPAPITFTGTAPAATAIETWAVPWIPLILEWEMSFTPVQDVGERAGSGVGYPTDAISANWQLDAESIELTRRAGAPQGTARTYTGATALAAGTEVNLRAEIARYLRINPDDPNAAALTEMEATLDIAAMAQALSGLREALLMLHQILQMGVNDPLAHTQLTPLQSIFSNQTVPAKVGRENRRAALPVSFFNPLRAGTFQLTGLRVIDAFGQVRDIDPPNGPVISTWLAPPAGAPAGSGQLTPRISQGARLLLRLRSADDDTVESTSYPSTTPVCGWLAYNHLDDGLAVYDADGTAIGSLLVTDGSSSTPPQWVTAPGNAPTDITNAHLKAVCDGIQNHPLGSAYLIALLDAIDLSMASIEPLAFTRYPGLAELTSRPLAVIRATLRLELFGLPALDQSWEAFAASTQKSSTADRPSAAVTGVGFPVRIGDPGKLGDGVVGYFVDDGSSGVYETFSAPALTTGANGVQPPDLARTSLTPVTGDDTSVPLTVTLIMDPRGSVHALSGILPVKEITIPPAFYSTAMKRIAATFLTAPVLATAAGPELTLPPEPGYRWTWVSRQGANGPWQEQPQTASAPTAAGFVAGQRILEGWLRLTVTDNTQEER